MRIVLERSAALGNGDRKQGDTLATFDGDAAELVTAAQATIGNHDLSVLPCGVMPADGVEAVEILTALRNPQLVTFASDTTAPPESEPDDAGGDQPELDDQPKPRRRR